MNQSCITLMYPLDGPILHHINVPPWWTNPASHWCTLLMDQSCITLMYPLMDQSCIILMYPLMDQSCIINMYPLDEQTEEQYYYRDPIYYFHLEPSTDLRSHVEQVQEFNFDAPVVPQILLQRAFLHQFGEDVDRVGRRTDAHQLDEVLVSHLVEHFGLLQEVLLRHRARLHDLHGDRDLVLPYTCPRKNQKNNKTCAMTFFQSGLLFHRRSTKDLWSTKVLDYRTPSSSEVPCNPSRASLPQRMVPANRIIILHPLHSFKKLYKKNLLSKYTWWPIIF